MSAQPLLETIGDPHCDSHDGVAQYFKRTLYKCYPLKLAGRFMRPSKSVLPCELQNISVGDMALFAAAPPEPGENIIVYINELGRIAGKVVWKHEGEFIINIDAAQHRREMLAAKLVWLLNRGEPGIEERRSLCRLATNAQTKTMRMEGNAEIQVQLIDVSVSGASVATHARPPLGANVQLGRLDAEVVRHHHNGLGLRFLSLEPVEKIQSDFIGNSVS